MQGRGAPDALGAWGRTGYSTVAERGAIWMNDEYSSKCGPALGLWSLLACGPGVQKPRLPCEHGALKPISTALLQGAGMTL